MFHSFLVPRSAFEAQRHLRYIGRGRRIKDNGGCLMKDKWGVVFLEAEGMQTTFA